MDVKKIKLKKIKSNTILATGDQVLLKFYNLQCTLLNEITDGFIIRFDNSHTISCVTRYQLENHFLKI